MGIFNDRLVTGDMLNFTTSPRLDCALPAALFRDSVLLAINGGVAYFRA
jgi:hypothetical protein